MASRSAQTTRNPGNQSPTERGSEKPRSKKQDPKEQSPKKLGPKKRQTATRRNPAGKATPHPEEPLIPEHVARFLAELPMRGTHTEFQRDFCLAIKRLAGDIDTIACEMALAPNLVEPRERSDNWVQHVWYLDPETKKPISMSIENVKNESALQKLISRLPRILPEEIVEYHEPPGFEYWYHGEYLGTIALIRSARKSPVSSRTVESLRKLHRFVEYCITSFGMRLAVARILNDRAVVAMRSAVCKHELDSLEYEILVQRLLGYSVRQIAAHAGVSEAAVKKRFQKLYKRAGVSNFFELLWPYIQRDLAEQNARAAELKATEPEDGIYLKF